MVTVQLFFVLIIIITIIIDRGGLERVGIIKGQEKKKKKRFDEMASENQKQSQTNGEGKWDIKLFPMSEKYEFNRKIWT